MTNKRKETVYYTLPVWWPESQRTQPAKTPRPSEGGEA